ncbi:MAG TPA: M10 family metallopeptidase C-terminal domain-containing protein [Croceibacterium sp.]|nr:M10 family metallopeptidase C-terminal domain-containing protein [Croceibacterium sp.]
MTEELGAGIVGEWEELVHPLSTRDEIGFVVFNDRLWVIGASVVPPGASGHEVFSTADGINWTEHGPGDWIGQRGPTTVVFNGYIYLVGNAMQDDVWRTADPASGHWEKVLDDAPWGIRHGAMITVFDDKIWLMGGMQFGPEGWPEIGAPVSEAQSFNDIWVSEDGVNWTQALDHAPWGPRAHINGGAAVLNGRMYVVSGGVINLQPFGSVRDHVGEPYRDVWSTADGVNWTLETDHAPWTGRTFGSLAVYQNQLVLMGGSIGTNHRDMDHDIWVSNDGGKTWTEGVFPGLPRHASGMISFNDDLYIAGGLQTDDMWRLNGPKQNPDQAAGEDQPFSLTLDSTAFDTVPADPAYVAMLNDGSPLPAWLAFDPGTLTFSGTPENDDVGTIVVVVRATGTGDTGSAMFRLAVGNTNDAPLAQNLDVSINPDGQYAFSDSTTVFADDDAGDALSAIRIDSLPAAGELRLGANLVAIGQVIDAADLSLLKFTPAAGEAGVDYASFAFTTRDQSGSFAGSSSTIVFDVVALAPQAQSSSVVVQQGGSIVLTVADFGFSDANADDSLKELTIVTLPDWGQLTLAGTAVTAGQVITRADLAALAFEAPAVAPAGSVDLTFAVTDQTDLSSALPATFTIEVNRPPSATNVEKHIPQNLIFMPTPEDFGFADVDAGDQFDAIRIESLPSQGELLLNGAPITVGQIIPAWKAPQIAYIPLGTSNIVHQVEFGFSVRDSRGGFSQQAQFTLIVDTILYRNNFTGDGSDNVLVGDIGNNWIDGLGGNDLLTPQLGDDVLEGGPGNDTVSFAAFAQAVSVSLGPLGGQATGVGIKWFWNIENLIGGSGDDYFIGDAAANRFEGALGNDTLYGEDGDDVLLPGVGNDYLNGGNGIDTVSFQGFSLDVIAALEAAQVASAVGLKTITGVENLIGGDGHDRLTGDGLDNRLEGGVGNDVLTPGTGSDILDGGPGSDTVSFASLTQSIGATLGPLAGQGTGAGTKWLWNIENLVGGSGNDYFVGDGAANRLEGGLGDDRLFGEGGNDVLLPGFGHDYLDTGSGTDAVSFADLNVDITAALGMTDSESGAGLKTIRGADNLIGGGGNDRLTGDGFDNRLEGGLGNDVLTPGTGSDILDGGLGTDTVSFAGLAQNIGASLGPLAGQGTGAGTKWLWNIENLVGGSGNDHFVGDGAANRLEGGLGDDSLYGEGGNDVLLPGHGHDYLNSGSGVDTVSFVDLTVDITAALGMTDGQSGAGLKTIRGAENLTGGSGNDRLTGDSLDNRLEGGLGNDVLTPGTGNDILDGGLGTDTVSFAGLTQSIGATLGPLAGQGTGVGTKWLWGIENLVGGSGSDYFVGDGAANRLEGGLGDDRLFGEGGSDLLLGGLGRDNLHGGSGSDTFAYQDAAHSTGASTDSILDLALGDVIDLSAIDAKTGSGGNDAFSFIGSSAFGNAAGELRATLQSPGVWLVQGDINGDSTADLVISVRIADAHSLTSNDFIV